MYFLHSRSDPNFGSDTPNFCRKYLNLRGIAPVSWEMFL